LETRQHTIATALSNTSTWIFERPEFLDWVERRNISEHKGLLWIKGKPGSGKSVVMKNTLKRTTLSQPSSAIISFFFNARGGPLEKTPLGLFRSLLHQLLQQQRHLLSKFLPTYRTKRDTLPQGWKWQEGELCEYFSSIVTTAQVPSMTIFVDALDECEEEKVRRVVSFFAKLTSSAISSGCRLNVCMSSRHYPYISVPGCLEIFMECFNTPDISRYVESELWLQSEQEVDFQKEVAGKASGVFLWVVLVVELLLQKQDEGVTVNEMRQILRSVPDELDRLFTKYFDTINAKDRRKTLNLMQWILFAERPLTPMEINCALAFSVECPPKSQKSWQESDGYLDDARIEKVLRALSKGLVEITEVNPAGSDSDSDSEDSAPERIQGSRRVQFIHESVRDFLLHRDGLQLIDPGLGQSAVGKSHDQLTKTCIGYLSIEELQADLSSDIYVKDYDERRPAASNIVKSYTKYVFWDYAVRSVFKHATKAEYQGAKQRNLAQIFHWDRQSVFHFWRYFSDCLSTIEHRNTQGLDTVFLHVVSESGLTTCVSDLLDRGVDVNIRGGKFSYALAAAASKGHEATARLLLEKGADVKARTENGETALHGAAVNGHEAIARLLLEKGADVKAQNRTGWTALHRAAINGHEAVARLLLEKRADVKAQDQTGWTALHGAAGAGHEAAARLLLEKGADVKAQDRTGGTALHWAAINGHEAVARLLLEKRADVKAQDRTGWTALHRAAVNGHETVARLLLEKGADVKAQGRTGGTALHWAAENGHEATARLLLEKGADVKAQGRTGETALHWAADNGHEATARLLLEKGADVKAQGRAGETALHRAAGAGHEATARLLLEKRADVKAQDRTGWTALHWAAENGHEATTQLLLEKGADVKAQGRTGETALHWAADNGHEAIARLLLEKGADVKAQDRAGGTALHRATISGHEAVAKLLTPFS
jgi:ankyrin repeat protein